MTFSNLAIPGAELMLHLKIGGHVPDFVFDIPQKNLAIMFSLLAVAAVIVGLLVIKPLFRTFLELGPILTKISALGPQVSTYSTDYYLAC